MHIDVTCCVGTEDLPSKILIGIHEPRCESFNEFQIVLVCPQNPFPIGVLLAAGMAPLLELGRQRAVHPALMEDLG